MKMTRNVRKVWDAVTTLLVAAVAIMAVLLAGGRLVGLQAFSVGCDAMEPEYPKGSLIYVRREDCRRSGCDNTVAFPGNEYTAANRENGIGVPVFSVPYLGYVADFIQTPSGRLCALAGGAILLVLIFLPDLFSRSIRKSCPSRRKPVHVQDLRP